MSEPFPFFNNPNLLAIEINGPELTDFFPNGNGFPAANMLGTVLLAEVIRLHLRLAAQTGPVAAGGEFNASIYVMATDNFPATLKTVREALRACACENLARIYRYDQSELVLRCTWPEKGNAVSLADFLQRFAVRLADTEAFISNGAKAIEQARKVAREILRPAL